MKERLEELVKYMMAQGFFMEQSVELLERILIERALEQTEGNRLQAARVLGIHRNTLTRKIAGFEAKDQQARPKPAARAAVRNTRKRAS